MSGATLSQERFLLECAKQERRDLEREAWAAFNGDITSWPKQMVEILAARVCSRMEDCDNFDCAAAIRALKEQPA